MIKTIKMYNTPPYIGEKQYINPLKINFIFGSNGTGKTTISRFLNAYNNSKYSNCEIIWDNLPLDIKVYNQDYVKKNFQEESSIPGIFTLGEENIEIKEKIQSIKNNIKFLEDKKADTLIVLNGDNTTSGLNKNLDLLEEKYLNKFWKIKQNIDRDNTYFKPALAGVRSNKKNFKEELLNHFNTNKEELKEITYLEQTCSKLFDKNINTINKISKFPFDKLINIEKNSLLKKIIIGKEDIGIAQLIKKLDNDSWVRKGKEYLDKSDGKCPFCQNILKEDFSKKLEEYFDETYINSLNKLNTLYSEYNDISNVILKNLKNILTAEQIDFLEKDKLKIFNESLLKLEYKIKYNIELLIRKKDLPNIEIILESTSRESEIIEKIISEINKNIDNYNIKIANIKSEREKVKLQVWKFIVNDNCIHINDYLQEKSNLIKLIEKQNTEISKINKNLSEEYKKLHLLEKKQTSIIPTAEGINSLLKNYGFTGFHIKADDNNYNYRFIRDNGEDAFNTLSEGERNFVTFLYFIYSLNGSVNGLDSTLNKIVVVDDPVSSLDNDILYIVSTLLRDLFKEIYNEQSSIKQLFILSHNIYFFKEVSYKIGIEKNKTRYYLIQKNNETSKIKEFKNNPVSSTYEMLWDEIRNANQNSSKYNTITLANTMRRIIEYYFKFLGNIDLNKIHLQFKNGERQLIKSLLSWVNAGSHSSFEDFSAAPNIFGTEIYLEVFKKLFEFTGHIAHYNMMMRINEED